MFGILPSAPKELTKGASLPVDSRLLLNLILLPQHALLPAEGQEQEPLPRQQEVPLPEVHPLLTEVYPFLVPSQGQPERQQIQEEGHV